jgi:hypothetical protein
MTMMMSVMCRFGRRLLRPGIAASISSVAMLGPFGVHAQEATDKFSKCDWINEAVQGFGPDYSFVDSMQPDAVLPGARSWGPICVNVDQATEEWFEARPKRELDHFAPVVLLQADELGALEDAADHLDASAG